MNKYFFRGAILLLLLSSTLSACKKEISMAGTDDELAGFNLKPIEFDYLSTRSKVSYKDGSNSISATASIRVKKDSLIWVSLSPALGIEAARGIITRDSVLFMDRINRNLYEYDFKSLSQRFQMDLNFDMVQSLIIGEMPNQNFNFQDIKFMEPFFVIAQKQGYLDVQNYIGKNTQKLERLEVEDRASKNNMQLVYGNFQALEEQLLPFESKISVNYRQGNKLQETTINLEHQKAEFSQNPLSFPFSVPNRFERKQ